MSALRDRHCRPLSKETPPLDSEAAGRLQAELDPAWVINAAGDTLEREFRFRDFYRTIAFVNAVAWIANGEDHHPDLEVGYSRCRVRYSTHSVGGLSENDFVCAARIDALTHADE